MSDTFTTSDVAKHKDAENGYWLIVENDVYDVTSKDAINHLLPPPYLVLLPKPNASLTHTRGGRHVTGWRDRSAGVGGLHHLPPDLGIYHVKETPMLTVTGRRLSRGAPRRREDPQTVLGQECDQGVLEVPQRERTQEVRREAQDRIRGREREAIEREGNEIIADGSLYSPNLWVGKMPGPSYSLWMDDCDVMKYCSRPRHGRDE